MEKINVLVPGSREKFLDWIATRGGVRVWRCIDLGNLGAGEMFTPAFSQTRRDGDFSNSTKYPKPHWDRDNGNEVITDISRFRFAVGFKEVKRFHVAKRLSNNGLSMKCTDASSAKITKALEKFPGSYCEFDYMTQEVVISIPEWENN